MKRLAANATNCFLQFGFYITALRPLKRLPLLNLVYRLAWLSTLFGLVFLMFSLRMYGGDVSLGGLVGTALFVCNALVYMVCIAEAMCTQRKCDRLARLQRDVDALIGRHLRGSVADVHIARAPVLLQLLPLLVLLYICDGLKVWIQNRSRVSPVFWPTAAVEQGLRMRYLQIIMRVMEANQRVALLQQSLQHLVRHNQPKSKYGADVWQPYAAWEYDQLHVLRLIYGRIFELYLALNECFGWSILFIFLTSFFGFVCNAFWSFAAVQAFRQFDKYAFNGGTTVALGALVSMLFWSTDVGHSHVSVVDAHKMQKSTPIMTTRGSRHLGFIASARSQLARLAYTLLYLGLWTFALAPYFTAHPLLNALYSCLWISEIVAVTALACYYQLPQKDQLSLVGMVTLILFLTEMTAHLVIVLDSWFTRRQRAIVYERFAYLQLRMSGGRQLKETPQQQQQQSKIVRAQRQAGAELGWYLARQILIIGALLLLCHLGIIWTTAQMSSANGVALYWYSLPSALALQFKMLEFFSGIVCHNSQLAAVRRRLGVLAERNFCALTLFRLPLRRQAVEVCDNDDDGEAVVLQLDELKLAYGELYASFRMFNDCYGWSMLAFAAVYFTDLVCNSFWLCLAVITQGRESYALVRSAGFVLIVVVLLSALCWHCQQSSDHSRQIGCILFKLVKPLGNKRYNDLLSEFALQVLHQQFVITAKEFFNLNLNLLGSMVAAIVTYLIILIQFMISERSNPENAFTTPDTLNASAVN